MDQSQWIQWILKKVSWGLPQKASYVTLRSLDLISSTKGNDEWSQSSVKHLLRNLQRTEASSAGRVIGVFYTFLGHEAGEVFCCPWKLPRGSDDSSLSEVQTIRRCTVCTEFWKYNKFWFAFYYHHALAIMNNVSDKICSSLLGKPPSWYATAW